MAAATLLPPPLLQAQSGPQSIFHAGQGHVSISASGHPCKRLSHDNQLPKHPVAVCVVSFTLGDFHPPWPCNPATSQQQLSKRHFSWTGMFLIAAARIRYSDTSDCREGRRGWGKRGCVGWPQDRTEQRERSWSPHMQGTRLGRMQIGSRIVPDRGGLQSQAVLEKALPANFLLCVPCSVA